MRLKKKILNSLLIVTVFSFAVIPGYAAEPIRLTGINGKVIAFDGIREAVPKGLWLKLTPDSKETAVPWAKFDIPALKSAQPKIYAAWEAGQKGESTLLELGSYERSVVDLSLANVSEAVSVHSDAKNHPGAEALNILPYLYKTGSGDHPLPFRFYAPDIEYRENDEKLPLVIWLHGAGSGGTDNSKNVSVGLAKAIFGTDGKGKKKCFIMYPQFHDEYNWWTYVSSKRGPRKGTAGRQIIGLTDEICEKIPAVDSQRIYLMGLSQGGFGIPYLVTAYPNRFAAQVLISGMTWSVPWNKKNVIPSWLFYSEDDPIMHQNGKDYGAEMTAALLGVADKDRIKVTIYKDAGHVGPMKRALENPELFPWLFKQKSEGSPKRDEGLMSKHFD